MLTLCFNAAKWFDWSVDFDPENADWHGASTSRLSAHDEEEEVYDEATANESYRKAKTARTLRSQPAMGEAYRGKKVSRSSLSFLPAQDSEEDLSQGSEDENGSDVSEMNGDTMEGSDSDEENGLEISFGSDEAGEESGDSDGELEDDADNYGDFDGGDDVDDLEAELMGADESEVNSKELQRLKEDASEELTKAQHALNQRVLWDAMLDLRLKLQKPQSEMNRFPQFSELSQFLDFSTEFTKRLKLDDKTDSSVSHKFRSTENGDAAETLKSPSKSVAASKASRSAKSPSDEDDSQSDGDSSQDAESSQLIATPLDTIDLSFRLRETKERLRDTIGDLLELQSTLIRNNEEIEEELDTIAEEKRSKGYKRFFSEISSQPHDFIQSLDVDDLWTSLESYHEVVGTHAEETVDKWARKVLYSADNLSAASKFKAVNQSISSQVDQIMSNKDKVIGRTRLKREQYRVLGKSGSNLENSGVGPDSQERSVAQLLADDSTQESSSHDAEIFDDGDFCQILLKEVLEAGLTDTSDPIEMTRRFLALRASRRSFNSKSDRKPSKGKTLKFAEQQKLVAFMAPVPNRYPSHDAYITSQLIISLFGQHPDWVSKTEAMDIDSDEEVFA